MSHVELKVITPDAEKMMAKIARVSSPKNENNPSYAKLLKYCIDNKHWSVFEHAHMTLTIKTLQPIATQILRHRSFTFQQFSQRYSEATSFNFIEARRQDLKNRQSSIPDLPEETTDWFLAAQNEVILLTTKLYKEALDKGIAKECARFLLSNLTETKMHMTGNIRSWITYIQLRESNGTQKEHQEVALMCKEIFTQQLPEISKALGWIDEKN